MIAGMLGAALKGAEDVVTLGAPGKDDADCPCRVAENGDDDSRDDHVHDDLAGATHCRHPSEREKRGGTGRRSATHPQGLLPRSACANPERNVSLGPSDREPGTATGGKRMRCRPFYERVDVADSLVDEKGEHEQG